MYYLEDQYWKPRGWICPVCGHVYSPSTPMCYYCSSKDTTITATETQPQAPKEYITSWEQWLKQATNIQDYPDWEKTILNPSNVTDSDTFRVHFDKTITYKE